MTTIPPKPDLNTTVPPSPPLPTTLPSVTSQPPVVNVTLPPLEEATKDVIGNDNVTHAPDGTPTPQTPPHPGTVAALKTHSWCTYSVCFHFLHILRNFKNCQVS